MRKTFIIEQILLINYSIIETFNFLTKSTMSRLVALLY